jgi:hypothetical protein
MADLLDVKVYTTGSGNWSKPTGAVGVRVILVGGGGGGGGGDKQVSGTIAQAGSSGGGACMLDIMYDAADLGTTEAYSVAAGGTLGAAGTGSSGGNGGVGGSSTFGGTTLPVITAYGGGGGIGGQAVAGNSGGGGGAGLLGAGGVGTTTAGGAAGTNGGAAGTTGAGGGTTNTNIGGSGGSGASSAGNAGNTNGDAYNSAPGGGAGGGKTTAPAYTAGGNGGRSRHASGSTPSGAGGVLNSFGYPGRRGGLNMGGIGCGAGGAGGAGDDVTAGAGGDGGFPGAGAGGGGGSLDTGTAGAGGTGGSGMVAVLTYGTSQAFTGLLDMFAGAAVAYSFRKLRDAYAGSAVRIRRDNDDAEADIGFDAAGDFDTAAAAAHIGANNGFIVTWYDQSGNGLDVTQATESAQPAYSATGFLGLRPGMDFNGSTSSLQRASVTQASMGTTGNFYWVCASEITDTSQQCFFNWEVSGSNRILAINQSGALRFDYGNDSTGSATQGSAPLPNLTVAAGNTSAGMFCLLEAYRDSGDLQSYLLNGLSVLTPTSKTADPATGTGTLLVGRHSPGSGFDHDGFMGELILWKADPGVTARASARNNLQNYWFDEMPLTFPITAALLDDFNRTDAATLGANWTALTGDSSLEVVSNEAKDTSAGGVRGNYWNAATFGNDVEAYFVCGSALGGIIDLRVGVASPADDPDTGADGYSLLDSSGTVTLRRIVSGSPTTLHTLGTYFTPLAETDGTGLRRKGNLIQIWNRNGVGTWQLICTLTDSTHQSGGSIVLRMGQSTGRSAEEVYVG